MGFNKGLIMGLIIVSIFFIGLAGLLFSVSGNYNITVDSEYSDTFNKYSASNELVQDIESTVEGGEVNPEGLDASVYTNVVVAGKQSRQSAALAQDLVNEVPKIFGVEAGIIAAIISIIFLLGAMGFIGMIARKEP